MDSKRRIMAAVLLAVVLGGLGFAVIWSRIPRYQLLYASLTERDRSEIIAHLEEMRIPYRATMNGGIEVPNAVSVRANLLQEGIPRGGVVGWEVFDQNSFSATDFSNEINRQRAIAGELTRTLQRLDGIVDAKILLNLPDPNEYLFADEKPDGTASVQLQLRGRGALSQSQVEAIASLVATSTGIKPDNVTIIDNYANDLTAQLRSKKGPGLNVDSATQSFDTKLDYEIRTERRIESMLSKVFGFNKAVVRVNADLDLDYQEVKSETFDDVGVPRSEQERSETYQGTGGIAYGVPGTDSNVTQYRAQDDANSTFNAEKTERTVNYEISRVEEFRIGAPGRVRRLSVGVWVDGNLPEDVRQKVVNTVSAAVGIVESRGDQLMVETIEFGGAGRTDGVLPEIEELPWPMIVLVGVLILASLGVVVFLRRRAAAQRAAEEVAKGGQIDLINADVQQEQAAGLEPTPEEKARLERLSQLEKLAREKPDEVAALLKTWLTEDY